MVLLCCVCRLGLCSDPSEAQRECWEVHSVKALQPSQTVFNESLCSDSPLNGQNKAWYVLDLASEDYNKKFEVRVSYLGSPLAAYNLRTFKVQRDELDVEVRMGLGARRLADTERIVVSPLQNAPVAKLVKLSSILRVCSDQKQSGTLIAPDIRFVTVVELTTLPTTPSWAQLVKKRGATQDDTVCHSVTLYNIKLDPLVGGLVPRTMLPVVVGVLLIIPFVFLVLMPAVHRSLLFDSKRRE